MQATVEIKLLTDHDGHWYWIPAFEVETFHTMLMKLEGYSYNDAIEAFDEFSERFEKFRTNGDPNNTPEAFKSQKQTKK